jgi:hypothetical protein
MGTHSLVRKKGPLAMVRNDRPVLERYLEGDDQARGVGKIGHVTFKPDTIHDLRKASLACSTASHCNSEKCRRLKRRSAATSVILHASDCNP